MLIAAAAVSSIAPSSARTSPHGARTRRLQHRLDHLPGQMSGGEQQRVGIARALVTDPALIVADETDRRSRRPYVERILDLLQTLQAGLRKTIILVTHDPRARPRELSASCGSKRACSWPGSENTLAEAFPGWQGSL